MEQEIHVGIVVRCLNNKIGRAIHQFSSEEFGNDSTTPVQGWIVRYLYEHKDEDVFQRDLEARFSVRRSTMTSILQLMEKNGLITKAEVTTDKRLKKLLLTPLAIEKQQRMKHCIDELEKTMKKDLSEDELKAFVKIAEKIGSNLTS